MAYNQTRLPLLRGFHKKIHDSRKRLLTEIGVLSLSLGADCLESPESMKLEEIVSLLKTANEEMFSLTKRTKTIIQALER